MPIDRREFLVGGAAAGIAAVAPPPDLFAVEQQQAPAVHVRKAGRPIVVASSNGHRFKNGGAVTCVEKAFTMLASGADPLDAVIAGVNIVELDPDETSVGYGGLPNADGVVQLDASVMHGPTRRAGAVACLEGVRTPSSVARAVMDATDHLLLVGHDAQAFARQMGFRIEDDLNTDRSRRLWLEWKRRVDPEHYPGSAARAEAGFKVGLQMVAEGLLDANHLYGTINCNAVSPAGDVCGVTTTSGRSWKIPGRVGDSPIIGAGLYVDNEVGAAGSTGRGEANMYGLCSFLIVEEMRRGATPRDAAITALKRIRKDTVHARLLNSRGLPNFNVSFYVVTRDGQHAGVSLYADDYAVCTEHGAQTLPCEAMHPGKPQD